MQQDFIPDEKLSAHYIVSLLC